MRERKLRQLDRTITRLEKLVESIPKRLSNKEIEMLKDFKMRVDLLSFSVKLPTELVFKYHLEETLP
jgi:hypothetical protein